MQKLFKVFLTSVKAQLSPDAQSYKAFIVNETYLNGEKFSFKDHEYQEYIIDVVEANPGCTFSVLKNSQIGLSEIFNRLILARMAIRPGTGVIISFPSKSFSQEVLKTRFSPIIRNSPTLKALIDHNNDSGSVKQMLNGSIMYALGGNKASSGTLLNRPADIQFIDEIDKQDPDIVSGYDTRTVHAGDDDILTVNVSTPTADGIGISAEIQESRVVHTAWIGCQCGHEFIGDFFEHVKVPGFTEPIVHLTQAKASSLDISKSYLECPECKQEINKGNKKTVWKVTYNPEGVVDKIGIVLDPFAAMGFITMHRLVKRFLKFKSKSEFLNQCLGKVAEIGDTSIVQTNIKYVNIQEPSGQHIFGLDLGKSCHWMHGILRSDTTVHVLEPQIVPLNKLEEFLKEQHTRYVFHAGVADSQPYSDLIYRLVKTYPRLFSAIYISPNPPKPELFSLRMTDNYEEVVRQVTINKSLAMDSFAGSLADFYTFQTTPLDSTITKHFMDMRRVRDYRFEIPQYKWVKSTKGVDHFFHTAIYLSLAAKLALANVAMTYSLPFVISKMNPERLRAEILQKR